MRVRNVMVSFLTAATFLMAETAQERLKSATAVFNEVMETPDKGHRAELAHEARMLVLADAVRVRVGVQRAVENVNTEI